MHTKIVKLDPNNIDPRIIKEAAQTLQNGGIVAFPTETVYGLAADYNNKYTIDRLYNIKRRRKDKQFTIHIAQKEKVLEYVDGLDELTKKLIDKFWPGPLTIIVRSKDGGKIGFRMPSNKIAIELINKSGITVVAPSANISGESDPIQAFSVVQDFDGLIDMVIDAGPTKIGVASTVIDLTTLRPKILREGSNIDEVKFILQEDKKITNILVVCSGNSCRSPMAEGLFKRELEKDGFNIKSAGIIAVDGASPSPETVEVMKKYAKINMPGFLTHRLTEELTRWADIIFVMDKIQKDFIENTIPAVKAKAHFLKEFAGIAADNPGVPDPIGRPFFAYEESYKQIEEAVNKIAMKLRKG